MFHKNQMFPLHSFGFSASVSVLLFAVFVRFYKIFFFQGVSPPHRIFSPIPRALDIYLDKYLVIIMMTGLPTILTRSFV